MSRLPLNQTSLHEQSKRLSAFERFLPSVDLKRRQLIAERNKAIRALAERREDGYCLYQPSRLDLLCKAG